MSFAVELVRAWVGCCPGPNVRRQLSAEEAEQRRLTAHKIACPVLASMFRAGYLNPTPAGVITWQDLFAALRIIGFCRSSAMFQAFGIAAYRAGDTQQTQRARGGAARFLNIFAMSPGETSEAAARQVQHGFSSVIRDSRHDTEASGAADAAAVAASVRASRKARFDETFGGEGIFRLDEASGERRCYLDGLGRVLAHLKTDGDKAGEWSSDNIAAVHPKAAAAGHASELSEWQPLFAFCACWVAFGDTDAQGARYMTEAALESMYLDSHVPIGWAEGRRFGFEEGLRTAAQLELDEAGGLLLPQQIEDEIFTRGSRTCCRVHMAAKFASFLGRRGLGLDPDPPTEPDPKGTADYVLSALVLLLLVLAFARGCIYIGDGRYAWGLAAAAVPTLCAASAGAKCVRAKSKGGGGGGSGGAGAESRTTSLLQ